MDWEQAALVKGVAWEVQEEAQRLEPLLGKHIDQLRVAMVIGDWACSGRRALVVGALKVIYKFVQHTAKGYRLHGPSVARGQQVMGAYLTRYEGLVWSSQAGDLNAGPRELLALVQEYLESKKTYTASGQQGCATVGRG